MLPSGRHHDTAATSSSLHGEHRRSAAAGNGESCAANCWPNTRPSRVRAQRAIDQFHYALLTRNSATMILEDWCTNQDLAERSPFTAAADSKTNQIKPTLNPMTSSLPTPLPTPIPSPPLHKRATVQAELQHLPDGVPDLPEDAVPYITPLPDEVIRHRRVHLTCDGIILSKADNWYIPSRMDPGMDDLINTTKIPYGKVIASLRPTRTTLFSRPTWQPASAEDVASREELTEDMGPSNGIEEGSLEDLRIPDTLLEVRAVVRRGDDGRALSFVVEYYQGSLLSFAAQQPPNSTS